MTTSGDTNGPRWGETPPDERLPAERAPDRRGPRDPAPPESSPTEHLATPETVPVGESPRTGGARGLADSTARGFVFYGIQSIGVRLVRFGGNFALAWLLIPDDFTLYVLTMSITHFISVLRNAGVRDIIVIRQKNVRRWINPGAWLALTIGGALSLLLAATAPLFAMFFERPELTSMLWIMSATTLAQSFSQVPAGLLQARMRFRLLATLEGVQNSGMMLLTVYFAFMGLGAMSFVLPILIGAICRSAALWYLAKPKILPRPQFRRWRYIIGDSVRLASADIARTVTLQGDMLILGRMFPGMTAVGHYAFGNSISRQSMMMVSRNLDLVLFPTLAKIQDDRTRQTAAFVRALRLLALIGVPLCFLQAAVADPLIHALVPERFYGAVSFIVVLSVGMAGRLMISPAESMLRSQGRFSTFSKLNWIFAFIYMGSALFGGLVMGDAMGVAIMIGLVTSLGGVVYVLVALAKTERTIQATARVFAFPVLGSSVACGLGWWSSTLLPRDSVPLGIAACALVVVVAAGVYIPLAWIFERSVCHELFARITGVLGTKLGGKLGRILRRKSAKAAVEGA